MQFFFHNKSNRIWLVIIIGLMIFNIWNIIVNTPMVPDQHWAQKIFYVHVPSAWVGFLSYFIVMVAGIMYFIKGDEHWVLITGPIWATPIWGQPWIWEPRLTTTLILFLIYMGYFMMRAFGGHAERVKRYAASLGIIAFVDVPIIFVSVKFWAPEIQSHPQVEMTSQPPDILIPFLLSLGIFTVLYWLMLKYRIHVIKIKNKVVANV